MQKKYLRFILFAAAALLTVVLPFLLLDKVSVQCLIALAFAVLAEGLLILQPINLKNKNMPIRLPLLLYIYPLYLAVTLLLVVFSAKITWRYMLAFELLAAFPVLAAYVISALASGSEEDK